jgi:hypothetical protein
MAYLGRKGASAALTSADIPDNSITAAKIVEGTITVGDIGTDAVGTDEIADDAVTGAKIENNPTIAGNLTVTGDIVPSTPLSNRNMIINGAMQINQRGDTGATTSTGFFGPDRFGVYNSGFTGSDPAMIYSSPDLGTTGPDGIRESFHLAFNPSNNVTSVGANDNLYMRQIIEAQDLQHLQYGNASAKDITLSFYVKTNMNTGGANTFSVSARTPDGSDRNIGTTYTAADSNWNRYTWTIPADTSGQIDNNNDRGMIIQWKIVSGSDFTSVANTSWASHANNRDSTGHTANILGVDGQTWEITGVQLELGSNATPFEHRSYGEELLKCKRYYQELNNTQTTARENTSTRYRIMCSFPVEMRATPTLTRTSNNLHFQGSALGYQSSNTTHQQAGEICATSFVTDFAGFSGLPDGGTSGADINHAWNLTAEL